MPKAQQPRLGKQSPRYRFFLSPYPEAHCTVCPWCHAKTRQRKLPLVIHVDPLTPVALNKTCRCCPACDLLIAHQDELEALLTALFAKHNPEVIGNEYLVIGTLDRPDWQRGGQSPMPIREMVEHLHDFKEVVRFEITGGWQIE
ncbi:MAG: hypothetical protein HY675_23415 [Chloroflexi bacterium]|nr:hypothetical protein [Chloroflexota bacterium]